MAKPYRISPSNPFDDTLFAIRATINGPEISSFKIRRIEEILDDFHKIMEEREQRGITGLQGFPKGDEE